MKRSKIIIIVLYFSTFLFFLNYETATSIANPVPVHPLEFGGFIVKDENSCSMPDARVLIEINATDPYRHFDLEFSGNYTLYNPNETLNLTIAAPFSWNLIGLNSCTIKLNGSLIPYNIINLTNDDSWDEYIYMFSTYLIICNVTLPLNKTLILEYQFNTSIGDSLNRNKYVDIFYDIATGAAWNGTISERIEYKVHGLQPVSYSDHINLTIIDISDGKSYVWDWKNIIMSPGQWPVYISFEGNYEYDWGYPIISFGNWYIIFLLLGFISLLIVSERRVRRIKLLRL